MNANGINSKLLESKMVLKGHNRSSLAKAVEVSPHTISHLLNGKYSPTYTLMNNLYQELELTPEEASAIFFNRDLRKTKV